MKKVRWSKETTYSNARVEVFEDERWVPYKQSSICQPDAMGDENGYATFVWAIRAGYTVEPLFIRDCEAI
jgi:hypothetical protein